MVDSFEGLGRYEKAFICIVTKFLRTAKYKPELRRYTNDQGSFVRIEAYDFQESDIKITVANIDFTQLVDADYITQVAIPGPRLGKDFIEAYNMILVDWDIYTILLTAKAHQAGLDCHPQVKKRLPTRPPNLKDEKTKFAEAE